MVIYKITNLINGKTYIGQTKGKPEHRWSQHCSLAHNCRYKSLIRDAIFKYGKENFDFSIVEVCSEENSDALEIKYIDIFNSLIPNGYNLTTGGAAKHRFSKESKEKMRKAKLGTKMPETTRKALSFKGRHHSEETKRKMSEIQKKIGTRKGKSSATAKSIYGLNEKTGESWFFKNMSEAKKFGFDISNISAVCYGRLKKHKGFRWYFV